MSSSPSGVEEALRSQRDAWSQVVESTLSITNRDLPMETPKRILLFGVGSSHHAAKLCSYTLIRDKFRDRIPVVACNSLAIPTEFLPNRGDWAFGFSHRGKTVPTLKALEHCERAGAFTVLVAGKGVEQPESAKFLLSTCEQEKVEPHTVSLTSAVCAVTTLLSSGKNAEEWAALRSIGDPDLDTYRNRAGDGPTILLGEWEAEWLAREGALKLMEMARMPARAFSAEEFHHGPHFARTDKDKIWYLAHQKDRRVGDIKAAHQIGMFGSSPLAWVPALVELQWMALAVALNRGVDPDPK
jgi:fructoselysine-6-P-deglycase FrlB-like protein